MARRVFGVFGVVVLAAAVSAAGAAGQDAVKYTGYAEKVGDRVRTTKDETTVTKSQFAFQDNKKDETKKQTKTLVYVTKVLAAGTMDTPAAKVERTYEKAEETTDGKTTKLPLDGKTVVAEKVGDKYAFTFAGGGEVTGPAAAELDREFNKKKSAGDMFPDKPVKPGDTWDLADKVLTGMVGDDAPFAVKKEGLAATGKLLKIDRVGDTTFGEVEVLATLSVTEIKGKMPFPLKDGSVMTVVMTGRGCFDGSVPSGQTKTELKIRVNGEANGITLRITSDGTMHSKTELLK